MAKINILSPNVFNMLAAGEVVECPASVVKELVENSLDAGSTEISVYVEEGGIKSIKVSDNGVGVAKDDLKAAFLPHATSKIKNVEDLDEIATLGFRGEALASIASISKVTMLTKTADSVNAFKIQLDGGTVVYEGEDARTNGTTITVENLFFNTPARLKFLKKPASEFRSVHDVMRGLILANPQVSMSLKNENGDELLNSGGCLLEAICSVYGAKTADKLIEVDSEDKVIVKGYVSGTDFTKSNRSFQTLIVNGRTVTDKLLTTAIERAYGETLMRRAYPVFILDVLLPFDEVDTNVHPRKSEVRFRDGHKVFSAVYHAVQSAVFKNRTAVGFDVSKPNAYDEVKTASVFDVLSNSTQSDVKPTFKEAEKEESFAEFLAKTGGFSDKNPKINEARGVFDSLSQELSENDDGVSSALTQKLSQKISEIEERFAPVTEQDYNHEPIRLEDDAQIFDGKIIGQVFSTYILIERKEMLYVIDQHAAHERILYDKLASNVDNRYVQPLAVPYMLSLSDVEAEYFEKIMAELISLGFDIRKNSSDYEVYSVPKPVSGLNLSKFFAAIFENTLTDEEITLQGLLRDTLCQKACKSAIKGGDSLTLRQIKYVISHMLDENGNLPISCPHGRPAVIALTKRDFEKMFKRIV